MRSPGRRTAFSVGPAPRVRTSELATRSGALEEHNVSGSLLKYAIVATNYRGKSLAGHVARSAKLMCVTSAIVAALLGASGSRDAMACALESPLGFEAFSVSHRGVISVALATRAAVESGHLAALPEHQIQRRWLLARISRRAAAHIETLSQLDQSGPPLSVLLTQTGAWMRLNDPDFGARFHTSPPSRDELTILLPDVAYSSLVNGTLDIEDLMKLGVLRIFGDGDSTYAIEVFKAALQAGTRKKGVTH